MERKDLSSNWRRLQQTLKPSNTTTGKSSAIKKRTSTGSSAGYNDSVTRKISFSSKTSTGIRGNTYRGHPSKRRKTMSAATAAADEDGAATQPSQILSDKDLVNIGLSPEIEVGKYIAIDCEMVGVGPDPDKDSALARVSIVNYNGDQVYDSYVRPKEMVTDWRSAISGILPKHMVEARSLETVQQDVAKLLDGRILVGHAVRNDLEALLLSHSKRDIRDTSRYPPYRKLAGGGSPKLKVLASELLGLEIQGSAHSSVEDARATMMLFRRDKDGFEREHAKKWPSRPVLVDGGSGEQKKKKKPKKKKK
ncbi:RNA exonuclease 4 [Nannizzia gypsea CBS 118893]|uniref:RNA exonuclease 4 n=1 Tax=Arthroderma gypseum (strain ATCC MYA-4604 / CBS 118893) TaxID=535722 RepID=E4UR34_ARTGP|nr:RNA exonuclease 4 [Nannizzia gypsea CBS 118893]EFR00149.1 RNA exonuclease 4 [Nannizzia gypsea CBS 118893]